MKDSGLAKTSILESFRHQMMASAPAIQPQTGSKTPIALGLHGDLTPRTKRLVSPETVEFLRTQMIHQSAPPAQQRADSGRPTVLLDSPAMLVSFSFSTPKHVEARAQVIQTHASIQISNRQSAEPLKLSIVFDQGAKWLKTISSADESTSMTQMGSDPARGLSLAPFEALSIYFTLLPTLFPFSPAAITLNQGGASESHRIPLPYTFFDLVDFKSSSNHAAILQFFNAGNHHVVTANKDLDYSLAFNPELHGLCEQTGLAQVEGRLQMGGIGFVGDERFGLLLGVRTDNTRKTSVELYGDSSFQQNLGQSILREVRSWLQQG